MGIPGSPNPLLMRRAAAAADDGPYKIERSLRFNDPDSPYLKKVFSSVGNTRKWTFSCWIKLAHPTEDAHLLGAYVDTNNRDNFYLGGDNWFGFNMKNSGSWHVDKVTNMAFKDCAAWQHIVIRWDSGNSVAADRARLYVNGEEKTWGGGLGVTNPAQNAESTINKASSTFYIGAGPNNAVGSIQSSYWGGLMSDVQFIDGLSLHPAAFAEYSSAGTTTWDPKAFAVPTPNKGVTHSSTLTSSSGWNYGAVGDLFDGVATEATSVNPTSGHTATWKPATEITGQIFEIYCKVEDRTAYDHLTVNGVNYFNDVYDQLGNNTWGWAKLPGLKSINTTQGLTFKRTNGNKQCAPSAIRVDGVILVDGQTDKTYAQEKAVSYLNDGTTWSSAQTAAFDGVATTDSAGNSSFTGVNGNFTITFPSAITVSSSLKLQMYASISSFDTYCDVEINGSETTMSVDTSQGNQAGIYASNFTGSMTTLKVTAKGNSNIGLAQVIVDGTILINGKNEGVGTNSFHLKFNNTASNADLGEDSLESNDFTTVNNISAGAVPGHPNDGTTWSSGSTTNSVGNASGSGGWAQAFDGNTGNLVYPTSNNATSTITLPSSISFTKLELYVGKNATSGTNIVLNGTSISAPADGGSWPLTGGWGTVTSQVTSPLSTIGMTNVGGQGSNIRAIRIDDTIVQDGVGDDGVYEQDSLVDSPTNYLPDGGSDAAGGVTRGNYATLNPRSTSAGTLSNGNLQTSTSSTTPDVGTIAMTTGKFYWEVHITASNYPRIGVFDIGSAVPSNLGGTSAGWCFLNNASRTYVGGTATNYGSLTFNAGTVIGMAYDADAGKLWIAENNTWQASGNPATGANPGISSVTGSAIVPAVASGGSGSVYHMNFGARPFKYSAPSGFSCLCTQNLDDIFGANSNSNEDKNDPSKYFGILTYGGTSQARPIHGLAFQPDFVWAKVRNNTDQHPLFDVIRGTGKKVYSSATNAETTDAQTLTSFNSDGYSVGTEGGINLLDKNFVAWCWDAGTSVASTSNGGTATGYTRWTNATSGFSIIKCEHTTSGGSTTADHGLTKAPDFILSHPQDAVNEYWHVFVSGTGAGTAAVGYLNANDTWRTDDNHKISAVSSTQLTFQNYSSDATTWHYCWTSIPGYSAFGTYEGTGNASTGPFVYTGFRVRYLLTKSVDSSGGWAIYDSDRMDNGPYSNTLQAQWNGAEDTSSTDISTDFLSNGFKPRTTWNPVNASGTMMYAAFAQAPLKTARAR